ncbi:hypothetical protein OGAPHI_005338 [Ogataea philodendri]|uniref:PH-response regulator protein palH/RIM21 n=1 Tax=Ogataea philodendri TaxID=1378263 RepID=A0A9P8T206_9ASCO|nr:uncharacterized protein OGAPHI_005338 [Ogataea philodendri]KAH3663348.1 hypothetical protein OGAPHI_005338 [Ogataea philodendri]
MVDLGELLHGNYSIYQLEPGGFQTSSGEIVNTTHLSLYFANVSDLEGLHKYLQSNGQFFSDTILPSTRDSFMDSVLIINFVMCSVAVASWLLFILAILASGRRPWYLHLTTFVPAVFATLALVRLSDIMQNQFENCYQDQAEVVTKLFNQLYAQIPFCVIRFMICYNWYYVCERMVLEFSTRTSSNGGKLYRVLLVTNIANALLMTAAVAFNSVHYFLIAEQMQKFKIWINLVALVLTCIVYVYIWSVATLFWMFRVDFDFKLQTVAWLIITVISFWLSTALQIVRFVKVKRDPKWLLPLNLFFELLAIHLIVEFITSLENYNHQTESRNIVGRETVAVQQKESSGPATESDALEFDVDSDAVSSLGESRLVHER